MSCRSDTSTTDVEWYRDVALRAGITRWSRPDLVPLKFGEQYHPVEEYRRAWEYFCRSGASFTAPDPPYLTDFTSNVRDWIERSGPPKLDGGWYD